eukprot:TRINITY_DN10252_c0_g1_i1.p1 TRINITY_DN10252_c0_g1~~TRINITY_DN10252_c0_g1_i1.p1  ORF type:complete len:630 (-),score=168.66 TRINITY_DN10252_c0_g1_i1:15-1715(-)
MDITPNKAINEIDSTIQNTNDPNDQNQPKNEEKKKKKIKLIKNEEKAPKWMVNGKIIGDEIKSVEILKDIVSPSLYNALVEKMKLENIFPVQSEVIPTLIKSFDGIANDVVVCAPTGSGKTLSFAIPILHALEGLLPRTLRALIILPTRDLAVQVYNVFNQVASCLGLKVFPACGLFSFEEEQKHLVFSKNDGDDLSFSEVSGRCSSDILICTPGRLIDHLNFTKGFTLEYLRFLVLDEADRLMNQSYGNFLSKVLKHSFISEGSGGMINQGNFSQLSVRNTRPYNQNFHRSYSHLPLQKLIFSATISQNPKGLKDLSLNNPIYFSSAPEGTYKLPSSLQEFRVICEPNEKVLALSILLTDYIEEKEQVLVFTSSLDSTHRLFTVLKLMNLPFKYSIYSSQLPTKEKNHTLNLFREGKIKMLVCSDVMARGIDILTVKCVINYDVPVFVKTYVHRVGRTARAGQKGVSYSLLTKLEDKEFVKNLYKKIDNKIPNELKIPKSKQEQLIPKFRQVLGELKLELAKQNVIHVDYSSVGEFDLSLRKKVDSEDNEQKDVLLKLFLSQNKL